MAIARVTMALHTITLLRLTQILLEGLAPIIPIFRSHKYLLKQTNTETYIGR